MLLHNGIIDRTTMTDKSGRVEIPRDIAADVLFLADRTCCVCRQKSRPVQLHHIDDDPTNSVAENLAVLCFDCHRETQIRGGFDRKLDAAQVRRYKTDWNMRVDVQRSAGTQLPPLAADKGKTQVLRYFQIRERSEEYLYDFDADYVLVGTSDEAADSLTNHHINNFITSEHEDFRNKCLRTVDVREKMKPGARSRASYWSSFAISHEVSLFTLDVLSLEFQVWSYGAGAAHGNSITKTMNFQLHPSKELQLHDVFKQSRNYLGVLSKYCLDDLREQQSRRQLDGDIQPNQFKNDYDEWLLQGTAATDQNYERFSLAKNGIKIHFDPYRVAAYAYGKFEVLIPADILKPVMEDKIAALLAWN